MSRNWANRQKKLIREFLEEVSLGFDYENTYPYLRIDSGTNTGKTDILAPAFVYETSKLYDPSTIFYIGGTSKDIKLFQTNNEVKGVHCLDVQHIINTKGQRLLESDDNIVVVLDYLSVSDKFEDMAIKGKPAALISLLTTEKALKTVFADKKAKVLRLG